MKNDDVEKWRSAYLRKWTKIVIFTSITSQIRLTNMRSTVKKAAIFDVYADTIMSEKNHQAHPTSLPAIDFGAKLVYWCINVPIVNHRLKLQKRNAKYFASNWKKSFKQKVPVTNTEWIFDSGSNQAIFNSPFTRRKPWN